MTATITAAMAMEGQTGIHPDHVPARKLAMAIAEYRKDPTDIEKFEDVSRLLYIMVRADAVVWCRDSPVRKAKLIMGVHGECMEAISGMDFPQGLDGGPLEAESSALLLMGTMIKSIVQRTDPFQD